MASTSETTSGELALGSYVELHGLVNAPYLNYKVALVAGPKQPSSGRYSVSLLEPWVDPKQPSEIQTRSLSIKQENLRPISSKTKFRSLPCAGCRISFDKKMLQKCSQCRFPRYCSKDCQKKHWVEVHKQDCKILKAASLDVDPNNLPGNRADRLFCGMERGQKLSQRAKWAEAEAEFRYLIEREQLHYIGPYLNLGSALLAQGRMDEALVWFHKATMLKVVMPEDHTGLAESYFQMGQVLAMHKNDKAGAREALQEALDLGFPPEACQPLLQSL